MVEAQVAVLLPILRGAEPDDVAVEEEGDGGHREQAVGTHGRDVTRRLVGEDVMHRVGDRKAR
jgi:hypothetical protein